MAPVRLPCIFRVSGSLLLSKGGMRADRVVYRVVRGAREPFVEWGRSGVIWDFVRDRDTITYSELVVLMGELRRDGRIQVPLKDVGKAARSFVSYARRRGLLVSL